MNGIFRQNKSFIDIYWHRLILHFEEFQKNFNGMCARVRNLTLQKEIVQDQAVARATPVVDVRHPRARVTHEAALGSVDSRQLQTLMARGMTEDEAVDLIIRGLLRQPDEPNAT